MWYNVYNLVNQCLLFHFQDFPLSWIKCTFWLPYHNALAYSLYIKSNSSFFWFIVHALLKRYWYLQYLQSPFQGALTHSNTPIRHPHYNPMHPHQWAVRVWLLKLGSCWGTELLICFSIFLKRKAWGNAFGHYNAN